MQQNLNVQWHDFSFHLKGTLHDMLKTGDFTDVTLVCDDQRELQAHKVILSACSSVFRQMLHGRSNPNPIVFLKGVSHVNLDLILQFIYNGETAFPQTNLETFLDTARSLNIKELSDIGVNDQMIEVDGSKELTGDNCVDVKENLVKEEPSFDTDAAVMDSNIVTHPPSLKYFCDVCNYPYVKKGSLAKHAKDVHGKQAIYACKRDKCNYVSTERSSLKEHLNSHKKQFTSKITKTEMKQSKKAANNVEQLEQKMTKVNHKKLFACFLCMYKSEDKNDLTNHTLAEHRKDLESKVRKDFPIPSPSSTPTSNFSSNEESFNETTPSKSAKTQFSD